MATRAQQLADCKARVAELEAKLAGTVTTPPPDPVVVPEPTPPPSSSLPASYRLIDNFTSGVPTDWHWQISSPFTTKPPTSNGVVQITTPQAQANTGQASYSRRVWEGADMPQKSEWWFGGSWNIPDPAKISWSRLVAINSWTNSPSDWRLAVYAFEPGVFAVAVAPAGGDAKTRLVPVTIPKATWFDLDVHVKLSTTDGSALTEAYLDGQKVGSSTKANALNSSPIGLYQGGLAFWYPPNGSQTVLFDKARVN